MQENTASFSREETFLLNALKILHSIRDQTVSETSTYKNPSVRFSAATKNHTPGNRQSFYKESNKAQAPDHVGTILFVQMVKNAE